MIINQISDYYSFCTYRYWLLPGFVLKKMIMDNFTSEEVDPDIADSTDFLVERVFVILDFLNHHSVGPRQC